MSGGHALPKPQGARRSSLLPAAGLGAFGLGGLMGLMGLMGSLGCGRAAEPPVEDVAPPLAAPVAESPAPGDLVVFLGDSLTAGLGLAQDEAFPAVLERHLRAAGRPLRVVNAGVSGDTSAGGLARLDWLLRQRPDVLVVGLGANDGLRGLSPQTTRDNLRAIVTRARASGARVLLLGMRIPSSYGPEYTREFGAVYPALAAELEVPLVPFLLEGVGGDPELNLPDGIHPTAEGHRRMAETVLPHLAELLS